VGQFRRPPACNTTERQKSIDEKKYNNDPSHSLVVLVDDGAWPQQGIFNVESRHMGISAVVFAKAENPK